MPDPYMTVGIIHVAVAMFIIRKVVIHARRKGEAELAIPILIFSAMGLPILAFLWPGVWLIAAFCWIVGLITIPEAINKFRELRKELG